MRDYKADVARTGIAYDRGSAVTPGKATQPERFSAGPPIQRKLSDAPPDGAAPANPELAAAHATHGAGTRLPFFESIQRSFGSHDISGIQAHSDAAAAAGAGALGAKAFAVGNHVAFGEAPTLHTAAHEAAHVVQQRGGVQLYGGVGAAGDAHEAHADAVADRVVAGESAADLLDQYAAGDAATSGGPIRRAIGAGKDGAKVVRKPDTKTIYTARLQKDGTKYLILDGTGKEIEKDVTADDDRYDLAPVPPDAAGLAGNLGKPAEKADGKSDKPVEKAEGKSDKQLVELAPVIAGSPKLDEALLKDIGADTLDGAMAAAEQILEAYPPADHVYIGVGRSPALVTAYLRSQGCTTATVPLSNFRFGVKTAFGKNAPLDDDEEAEMMSHFEAYLPKVKDKNIVVIDFAMHGPSPVAAYNYIHRYYTGGKVERPTGDAFFEHGMADRWDYDDQYIEDVQIKLAVLCSRENGPTIKAITQANVGHETGREDELGRVSRLGDDDFLIVSPSSHCEDVFMGKLDDEALKGYSEHGKQGDRIRTSNKLYLRLVELYRQYKASKAPLDRADGKHDGAKPKEKLPDEHQLFEMLQSGVGLDLLSALQPASSKKDGKQDRKADSSNAAPAAAEKLPTDRIKKLTTATATAIQQANNDLLTQNTDLVQPLRAALSAFDAALANVGTIEQLIACLEGVAAKLEALAKNLPVKAKSRGLAEDVAERIKTLHAGTLRRAGRRDH